MNIVFSILVHENIEVVLNQIENFKKFNTNSGIILHVSKNFKKNSSSSLKTLEKINNVFINTTSIDTGIGDNSQLYAHLINIEYILTNNIEFEYIAFHASNDMFIKKGLYDYIKKFDAGSDIKIHDHNTNWVQAKMAFSDPILKNYLKNKTELKSNIVGSQVEGSFISKKIAHEIIRDVNKFSLGIKYNFSNKSMRYLIKNKYFHKIFNIFFPGFFYAKEEVYLAMLINCNADNITKPYVFINWTNNLKINESDISAIINEDYEYLASLTSRNYNKEKIGLFAVKRVDRDMNDSIRKLINNL